MIERGNEIVGGQTLREDFEDMFMNIIHRDILPEDELFDINDLKMLVGVDVKALSVPPQDLRKAMSFVKREVLKGGGLTEENRAEAVQELYKYLMNPGRAIVETIGRYERKLSAMDEQLKTRDVKLERLEKEVEEMKEVSVLNAKKNAKELQMVETKNKSLEESVFRRDVALGFLIASFIVWLVYLLSVDYMPEEISNPLMVFVAVQLALISGCILVVYPKGRLATGVVGVILVLVSIVTAFA